MNNPYEANYKALLFDTLSKGGLQLVRDGNYAYAQAGVSLKFESKFQEFPMLTSKAMFFKNVKYELHWLLSGSSNINYLKNNGVSIWNLWANEDGDLGETYGRILRSFNGIDQFKNVIDELHNKNESRRLVVSMWDPVAISKGNIVPCYFAFQFVQINRILNIIVSQRSADLFIGLPYDMALFTLLLNITAKALGLLKGKVVINIGNAHVYKSHYEAVQEYLKRPMHDLPFLSNNQDKIVGFDAAEVYLQRYTSEPFIKAEIIV